MMDEHGIDEDWIVGEKGPAKQGECGIVAQYGLQNQVDFRRTAL